MNEPTHLDLFSGIGGFALAAQWAGFRTIGFCEIDKYCQKILAKNFGAVVRGQDCEWCAKSDHRRFYQVGTALICGYCSSVAYSSGSLKLREGSTELEVERDALSRRKRSQAAVGFSADRPKIFGNIFDLDGRQFAGVDLITGGFPCQPFSVAGKRRGAADDRAIWPEMFRVIKEARPAWVLGENVPGIIPMELDNVLSDLEGIGYATRSFVIPACAVDARHRRDRLWIIGRFMGDSFSEQNDGERRDNLSQGQETTFSNERKADHNGVKRSGETLADSINNGLYRTRGNEAKQGSDWKDNGIPERECIWLPEPNVGRVAHGIPSRVHRLKGLGNAIVPQVAYEILREIRRYC